MRWLLAVAVAATPAITTPTQPSFPGPARTPAGGKLALVLVSSRYHPPGAETVESTAAVSNPPRVPGAHLVKIIPRRGGHLLTYGKDPGSARYVLGVNTEGGVQYGFDLRNYVWPPRIAPGEREFVYEQIVWAQEAGGVLYVENAHLTYAKSSYGRNAYITAFNLKTRKPLWRSPALVANANEFVVAGNVIVTGYGFTAAPDYLYLLDRRTGRVLDRLGLPTMAEQIVRHGSTFSVRTYDHYVVAKLVRS